jgi:hypothetical protein
MSNILVNQLTGNTTDTTIEVFAGHATDSTTRTNLEQGLTKAWMDYRGVDTNVINDSLNIASVADSGTGRYDPSFTNAMNTANYSSALGTNGGHILTENHAVHETGKFYLSCGNTTFGSFIDHEAVHVQINGDLA